MSARESTCLLQFGGNCFFLELWVSGKIWLLSSVSFFVICWRNILFGIKSGFVFYFLWRPKYFSFASGFSNLGWMSCFEIDFLPLAAWGFLSLWFSVEEIFVAVNYKLMSCVKFQSGVGKDFEFFWKVNSSQSSKIKKFSGHHSLQKVQIYFYVSSENKINFY